MKIIRHLDLFSGIGGFALAAEMVWPEVEHIFCDNEPFSQAILKKHWPRSLLYKDVREVTTYQLNLGRDSDKHISTYPRSEKPRGVSENEWQEVFEAGRIHLLTGGFPCQPFSQAGRRRGTEDDRHLWPEMLRVIREFHPRWIIGENVGGLVTWDGGVVLEQIHLDLEAAGYEVQAFIIPAVAVNAPHRRDRVWIVAHAASERGGTRRPEREGQQRWSTSVVASSDAPDTEHSGLQKRKKKHVPRLQGALGDDRKQKPEDSWSQSWVEVAARLCTLDDGLPNGLARPRGWRNAALKGAGNAIVPQVAAEIMRAIKEIDESYPLA